MRDEPKEGGFLYFHPPNLPKYLKLMHRIRQRYVDLQFSGMAESSGELRLAFSRVIIVKDLEERKENSTDRLLLTQITRSGLDDFSIHSSQPERP
jgi:hypothetical protein